jgi:hypothetical protein
MPVEPNQITAGFTVEWDKSLSDFPATLYTLVYTLAPLAGGEVQTITATANGSDFAVSLTPAQTAQFDSGDYQLTGFVKDIATGGVAEQVEAYVGRLNVLPGAESKDDRRTFAETVLQDLRDTYAKLAKNSISQATVNGKTYTKRDLADILTQIGYWETQVRNEQGGATKRIAVTFTRPT